MPIKTILLIININTSLNTPKNRNVFEDKIPCFLF